MGGVNLTRPSGLSPGVSWERPGSELCAELGARTRRLSRQSCAHSCGAERPCGATSDVPLLSRVRKSAGRAPRLYSNGSGPATPTLTQQHACATKSVRGPCADALGARSCTGCGASGADQREVDAQDASPVGLTNYRTSRSASSQALAPSFAQSRALGTRFGKLPTLGSVVLILWQRRVGRLPVQKESLLKAAQGRVVADRSLRDPGTEIFNA